MRIIIRITMGFIWGGLPLLAWAQPETDIYLANIQLFEDSLVIGDPINITPRKGYDNQPSFAADSKSLLYVAANSKGNTDIYQYDIVERTTKRITRTRQESEYSPMFTPKGDAITAVVVERDSSQRIWTYDPESGRGEVLIENITQVGYYTWLNKKRIAYFALGDSFTLNYTKVKAQKPRQIYAHIGRSLQQHPDGSQLFFVDKSDSAKWVIRSWTPKGSSQAIVETLAESEDFCFLPNGNLLMGQGSSLFRYAPEDDGWKFMAKLPIDSFYRLAVSPDGQWLALVVFKGEKP